MLSGQARRRGWAHLPSMWDPAWSASRVQQDHEVPVAPSLCLCPVVSTSPSIRAMLPSRNLPRASLRVMPGPISQILGRFGVQVVCLGWKRADQGRVMAKPSQPQPAAPWLPSEEVALLAKVHSSTNVYNIWHLLSPWLSAPRFWAVWQLFVTPWKSGRLHLFGNQGLFIWLFPWSPLTNEKLFNEAFLPFFNGNYNFWHDFSHMSP